MTANVCVLRWRGYLERPGAAAVRGNAPERRAVDLDRAVAFGADAVAKERHCWKRNSELSASELTSQTPVKRNDDFFALALHAAINVTKRGLNMRLDAHIPTLIVDPRNFARSAYVSKRYA